MSDLTKGAECSTQGQRLVNLDLLRTLAMFSVFDALVLKPVQKGCRWALRRISSC